MASMESRGPALSTLTWPEIGERIERGAGVIVPVGAIEQHGPHLPVSVDVDLPYDLALAVAESNDFLVAPPVAYGCRSRPLSGGGQSFPGTISVSARTFMSVLEDVVFDLLRQGFRRIALLNWHFENSHFTYEAATLAVERAGADDALVMVHDTPGLEPSEATMETLFQGEFPGWDAEHAAIYETSLMLHLHPETVLMDRAVDDEVPSRVGYDLVPPPDKFIARSGALWKATRATAEIGRIVWEEMVEMVAEELRTGLPPR